MIQLSRKKCIERKE